MVATHYHDHSAEREFFQRPEVEKFRAFERHRIVGNGLYREVHYVLCMLHMDMLAIFMCLIMDAMCYMHDLSGALSLPSSTPHPLTGAAAKSSSSLQASLRLL